MTNEQTDNWLVHDHRRFEGTLKNAIQAAEMGQWKQAIEQYRLFVQDLHQHMEMEDRVIYPAIEQAQGDPGGDLAELREEHLDIVRLLRGLEHVIRGRDLDHLIASLRPLYRAMREHDRFEEEVLENTTVTGLFEDRDEILRRLQALGE